MSPQKLKLGLFLDTINVPAWFYHSLERIANSDFAEFSLIIINVGNPKDGEAAWFQKLWENRGKITYEVFNKVDEKIFVRGKNALESVSLLKMLAGVPVVSLKPVTEGCTRCISPDDVEIIQNYDLDILIDTGHVRLCGEIITAARYGIWFFEHGDDATKQGCPPGFWEVVESRPVMEVALFSTTQNTSVDWAIYRSRFSIYRFSPARTRNIILWASSSFLPRQIELLHRLGHARFLHETSRYNVDFRLSDHKHYQFPTNLKSFRLYTRLFIRDIFELYQRLSRREAWCLLFDVTKQPSLSFADFNRILPPKDRFWADPQVIKKGDQYFIFVEEFIYKERKGRISVFELDPHGSHSTPVPLLETDYHLSYPFVFEYENKYYLIPESSQNRSIDLYECVEFPNRWEFKMHLMENIAAFDNTVFFYNGMWWLFTGVTENAGAVPEVELYLFYSDNLFSAEWKPHPLNPVVSDVTSARPAGRLFNIGEKIYRPSQDCSKTYGYGFNINEVLCLSETDYLEKKVATVKPNWDNRLIGTHTFTRVDGLTIIDGLSRRSKLF